MCGIAGVVSTTRESNITEAFVHHMCNQIVYSGPDESVKKRLSICGRGSSTCE